jgi:hypothetical protein
MKGRAREGGDGGEGSDVEMAGSDVGFEEFMVWGRKGTPVSGGADLGEAR